MTTVSSIPLGQGPIGSSAIGGVVTTTSSASYSLTAAEGSFTLTGVAAGGVRVYSLSAGTGAVTLTGIDAYLPNPNVAFAGAFSLTGQGAALRASRILAAEASTFALSGQAASPTYIHATRLIAAPRAFTLTGKTAVIGRNSTLDPLHNYVGYLHHCDSLTESTTGVNAVPIGGAAISFAVSKFGTGSFAVNGSNYFYSVASTNPGLKLLTNPFTIEGWFRFNTVATETALLWHQGAFKLGLIGGQIKFWATQNYTVSNGAAFTPTVGQWYNIAVDRDASNNLRIYIDGVMVAKTTGYTSNVESTAAFILGFGGGSEYFNGYIDEVRITKNFARYGSDAGFTVPTGPFSLGILSASPATFTATGGDATFSKTGPYLLARPGAFTLQGQNARLNGVGSGSYALTGQDAGLIHRIPTRLYTARGTFDLAGGTTLFERRKAIIAAKATFTLVGQSAQLINNQRLVANPAAYTFAGVVARALKWPRVLASGTTVALSGQTARLLRGRRLSATGAALTLTFPVVGLDAGKHLYTDPGTFTLSGVAGSFLYNQRLSASTAVFTVTCFPARLLKGGKIAANSGEFSVTGQSAGLHRIRAFDAAAGSFSWAGVAAKKNMVRTGKTGRFRLAGQGADLWAGWGGDAVGVVSSPAATVQVKAQGTAEGSVTAPRAQGAWSDR